MSVEFLSWSFKPTVGTADSQGTSRIHPRALLSEQNLPVQLDRKVVTRCAPCLPPLQLHMRRSMRGATTYVLPSGSAEHVCARCSGHASRHCALSWREHEGSSCWHS